MSRTNPRRRPPSPATGVCRWVVVPQRDTLAGGRLAINHTEYDVVPVRRKADGHLTCWVLAKAGSDVVYTVHPQSQSCDCPDARYNRTRSDTPVDARQCKHVSALQAALAALAKPRKPLLAWQARLQNALNSAGN